MCEIYAHSAYISKFKLGRVIADGVEVKFYGERRPATLIKVPTRVTRHMRINISNELKKVVGIICRDEGYSYDLCGKIISDVPSDVRIDVEITIDPDNKKTTYKLMEKK